MGGWVSLPGRVIGHARASADFRDASLPPFERPAGDWFMLLHPGYRRAGFSSKARAPDSQSLGPADLCVAGQHCLCPSPVGMRVPCTSNTPERPSLIAHGSASVSGLCGDETPTLA